MTGRTDTGRVPVPEAGPPRRSYEPPPIGSDQVRRHPPGMRMTVADRDQLTCRGSFDALHIKQTTAAWQVRDMYTRVTEGIGTRQYWSEGMWRRRIGDLHTRYLLLNVDTVPVGVAELDTRTKPDVEISIFGLLPGLRGRGLGTPALNLVTRAALALPTVSEPSRRPGAVWIHVSRTDRLMLSTCRSCGYRDAMTPDRDGAPT
jgi:GNAT superfamily N-acetyltransferase